MKKVFTLALVMAMAITSFAQVKSMSRQSVMKPVQAYTFRGFEQNINVNFTPSTRSIMTAPEEEELGQTYYDWQSNSAQRNFVAVWPDGYAVMCYTQATDEGYSDRGTGLAIWDPAVGEWEFTDTRVEGVKTGFGSIARYKENGLVVAAHTANDCRIFLVEDFRSGNRDFGQGIVIPTTGEDGRTYDPCWPIVQCSGENLDIIHIMTTEYTLTTPYASALLYTRYENNEFTVLHRILPSLDASHISDGGSNITFFMQYDPAKPNRVSFILNNGWSDGKLVISEDNGATWTDKVFYQHPDINMETEDMVYYPRWVDASFDSEDNLSIVYEVNATKGPAGTGSYYPGVGAIGFWSETLPKHDSCLGGIGNFGEPFIMDTTYLSQDIYSAEPYWSNQTHLTLPEHVGMMMALDASSYQTLQWDDIENWPAEYYWPNGDDAASWADHGKYNNGSLTMPSMHIDGNRVYAFWSMICGDGHNVYFSTVNQYYFRLFCNMSTDGGRTWLGAKQVLAENAITMYDEMVYGQLIPYVYTDAEGAYMWYCYQKDGLPGTYVMYASGSEDNFDDNPEDNFYYAVKVYLDYIGDDVEENTMAVAQTINVYPNPAQGAFNVVLTQESDVNIYNAVGQLVKTYNNVKEVNVNLESGVYFVNAGTQTTKVIVK